MNDWAGITSQDHKTYDPLCNITDPSGRARHPINCVDWERADTYCRATGGRLPTEAEWEFAARGSDGRLYPWGDETPSARYLNACGSECVAWGKAHHAGLTGMYATSDGFETTAPVGSFPEGKSRFGLMDVVGNVWEWVADWYAPYENGALVDPKGPETGTRRVMRGGAWNGAEPSWVRPTFRFMNDPSASSYGVGFRCAADPSRPGGRPALRRARGRPNTSSHANRVDPLPKRPGQRHPDALRPEGRRHGGDALRRRARAA